MSRAFIKEDAGGEGDDLPPRRPSSEPNYVTPRGLALLREKVAGSAGKDLVYFQQRLDSAILVDPAKQGAPDCVRFGASVVVSGADGSTQEFTVVGEDEADAAGRRISWCSPLARALLGARAGDKVLWKRPAGDLELEVKAIRFEV